MTGASFNMATDNVHDRMARNPEPRQSGPHQRPNQQHPNDAIRQPTITNASSDVSPQYERLRETYKEAWTSEELNVQLEIENKLRLLEEQNRKRLMMAQQEQNAMGGQYGPANAENVPAASGTLTGTPANNPIFRKTIQTHYTISEDEIGKGPQNTFAALALKTGTPRLSEPSSRLGTVQPVPTASTALSDNERKSPNFRMTVSPAPWYEMPIATLLPQQNIHSHSPSPTVQRQKQPGRAHWNFETTQGTQKPKQGHAYRYSPADVSGTLFDAGEACSEPSLSAGLDACAVTPNSSEYIRTEVSETYEVPERAMPELLSAEETSLLYFDVFQKMKQRIQLLEAANTELSRVPTPQVAVRVQTFHRLENENTGENVFLSEPEWMVNQNDIRLSARFLLMDPEGYIEKEKDISFVVYKCYSEEHQRDAVEEARKSSGPLPNPEPAYQDILLTSEEMVEALKAFFSLHPASRQEFPQVNTRYRLFAPFLWWYRHRRSNKIESLARRQAELVNALVSHIEEAYATLYDNVDEQLSRGYVSNVSMKYLFRPGQVLVSFTDGVPQGHIALSRPYTHGDEPSDNSTLPTSKDGQDPPEKYLSRWNISSRSISYRGDFVRMEHELEFEFETETKNGEIDISSLPVMPLEYTSQAVQERLMRRGQTFWKCRKKRLISFQGAGQIYGVSGGRALKLNSLIL